MKCDCANVATITSKYNGNPDSLVSILQDIQSEYRYLPEDALRTVIHSPDIERRVKVRNGSVAVMIGNTLGKAIDDGQSPAYLRRFGKTRESVFVTAEALKREYGKDSEIANRERYSPGCKISRLTAAASTSSPVQSIGLYPMLSQRSRPASICLKARLRSWLDWPADRWGNHALWRYNKPAVAAPPNSRKGKIGGQPVEGE